MWVEAAFPMRSSLGGFIVPSNESRFFVVCSVHKKDFVCGYSEGMQTCGLKRCLTSSRSVAQCMQSHLLTGLVKHQHYAAALEIYFSVGHYHQ